jgi:hypothetical protein
MQEWPQLVDTDSPHSQILDMVYDNVHVWVSGEGCDNWMQNAIPDLRDEKITVLIECTFQIPNTRR